MWRYDLYIEISFTELVSSIGNTNCLIFTQLNWSKYCYVISIIQFLHTVKGFQELIFNSNKSIQRYSFVCTQLDGYKYCYIRGEYDKFPDFFRMGTFIDSTHMNIKSPSKESPPAAIHLLYRSNNFSKAPWKSSCVSLSMTFVKASFISSIVSKRQPLGLGNKQKSQGLRSGL